MLHYIVIIICNRQTEAISRKHLTGRFSCFLFIIIVLLEPRSKKRRRRTCHQPRISQRLMENSFFFYQFYVYCIHIALIHCTGIFYTAVTPRCFIVQGGVCVEKILKLHKFQYFGLSCVHVLARENVKTSPTTDYILLSQFYNDKIGTLHNISVLELHISILDVHDLCSYCTLPRTPVLDIVGKYFFHKIIIWFSTIIVYSRFTPSSRLFFIFHATHARYLRSAISTDHNLLFLNH